MNNPSQNNDISIFMNGKHFCQGCDWFLVYYSRRRKRPISARFSSIEKWLLLSRSVAGNRLLKALFFLFRLTNYDTFAQVLKILNGLLSFFNFALLIVSNRITSKVCSLAVVVFCQIALF